MDTLKTNMEVPAKRHWCYIGCDGPPYCLASRIIEQDPDTYDWVTLLPGLGHLNMNQVKAYTKVSTMNQLLY
jgi:hypothetical protein